MVSGFLWKGIENQTGLLTNILIRLLKRAKNFMHYQRYKILGCPCVALDESEAVKTIIDLVIKKERGYTVAINAEKIWRYERDSSVRSLIDESIFPYPDGAGAVIGLRWLYGKKSEKVNMPVRALEAADHFKFRTFIVGASKANHELALKRIIDVYPNIDLVGNLHGFNSRETIVRQVLSSKPQLILIAMGSPKQEIVAREIISKLHSGIAIGCGGALDILSGNVDRAPEFMVMNNLEWLYRLWIEPERFRRQIFLPLFFLKLISSICTKRFGA